MQIPMLASILASIALGVINPTLGSGAMMASLTGFSQDNINFTRAREKEADRIGIDMLIRAGFNPRAMSAFFKKMQLNTRFYYTANIPAILRSHPLDEDRMAEADNRSLHLKASTHKDSLNYYLFKELIRNSTSNNERQLIEYYKKTCYQTNPVKAACDYGQALTRLHLHAFKEAAVLLSPHSQEGEHNFFFEIALAEAEAADTDVNLSLKRLETLSNTYTTNYALLMAHAEGLLAAGQTEKAVALLLKGSRLFKSDLALCEKLARAQSMNHQKAYAYFTKARCELMQGRKSDALRNLRLVKKMAKKDKYLLSRTEALM